MNDDLQGPISLILEQLRKVSGSDHRLEEAVARTHDIYRIPTEVLEPAAEKIAVWQAQLHDVKPRRLVGPRREPWFFRAGQDEVGKDQHWRSFLEVLAQSLEERDVAEVEKLTRRILNHCDPPGTPEISTRGLVIGYVQSGKTTNFTGLIASAADAGYRVFIVLSGLHSNLRRQTQERLDNDLVAPMNESWFQLTDAENDFGSPKNAHALLSQDNFKGRLLAVVKKNKRRLQNLNDWLDQLSDLQMQGVPIMVVDDEADQASLSSSLDEGKRTAINAEIVRLLDRPKAAYVGYTATPFANILGPAAEDVQDLYPRDFILSLPKPDHYFGPERIFGRAPLDTDEDPPEGCDMVRIVPQDEAEILRVPTKKAERQSYDPPLTDSLETAIDYFLLATADRRARGQTGRKDHSTMLIHVTHYVDAHDVLKELTDSYVRSLKTNFPSLSVSDHFRELWRREGRAITTPECGGSVPAATLDQVMDALPSVLDEVTVIADNGRSQDRLSYEDEHAQTVIVIGGNTLSRGLTLEGLVCSYFLRSSRNYDTLLQMGRWFGYRDGYEDLPRIWMDRDIEESFRFFALLEEEMRTFIAEMADDPNATPANYPVRIRTHPSMQITSALRMQNASVIRASFGSYKGESINYHTDEALLRRNLEAAKSLLSGLTNPSTPRQGVALFNDVEGDEIHDFLRRYRLHHENNILLNDPLLAYLRTEMEHGALTSWNVAVVGRGKRDARLGTLDLGLDREVNLISRSKLHGGPGVVNIGVLTSPGDYSLGLDGDQIRLEADPPLLLLYPISRLSEPGANARNKSPLGLGEHAIGMAVAFPGSPRHDNVEWAVPVLDRLADDRGDDEPVDPDVEDDEGEKNE